MSSESPSIIALPVVFESLDHDIRTRPESPPLPTGIGALDDATFGLHAGEITIIGGRPGEGKTSLALFMAYTLAAKGKAILFLSLEMTKEQLLERLFCHVCDVDSWALRQGQKPEDYDSRAATFKSMIASWKLHILDDFGYAFDELASIFTRYDVPPEVLILDYIQLVQGVSGQEERETINEYLKTLKRLAKRHHLAVVILSQMNRGVHTTKKSRPSLHQFKSTGALEETGDCCLLLQYRTLDEEEGLTEWKPGQRPDDPKPEFHIIVAKQRHGPIGRVVTNFHPTKFRFVDPPVTRWEAT